MVGRRIRLGAGWLLALAIAGCGPAVDSGQDGSTADATGAADGSGVDGGGSGDGTTPPRDATTLDADAAAPTDGSRSDGGSSTDVVARVDASGDADLDAVSPGNTDAGFEGDAPLSDDTGSSSASNAANIGNDAASAGDALSASDASIDAASGDDATSAADAMSGSDVSTVADVGGATDAGGTTDAATASDAASACPPGFADCNGLASDGCETNLQTDSRHCGTCAGFCSAPTTCMAGVCEAACSTVTDCPSRFAETASCTAGLCAYACMAGFGDCDGNAFDGCEVSLTRDDHCGSCGVACASGTKCSAGACVPAMHVGDLDAVVSRNANSVTVTITVHDGAHAPLPNAGVSITEHIWPDICGACGPGGSTLTCTTGAAGTCTVSTGNLPSTWTMVVFDTIQLSHPTLAYRASDNHDPDTDSDGNSIWVPKP